MRPCQCKSIDAAKHDGSLATFARVRNECAALKEIFVPDGIWTRYEAFCSADPDEAFYAPATYLAFKRRHLAIFTEPIHRFCLRGAAAHASLTTQYRNDLVERWMFKDCVKERFQHARIFWGRMFELLFAVWLHHKGWRIDSLEALGGMIDVEATCPSGCSVAFEVKHLGQNDVSFDLNVKALSGAGVSVGWLPAYSPVDYLVFRVFQAAKQLAGIDGSRIVVAILQEYDAYYEIPLKEHWINWQSPAFLRRDNDIDIFLREQYDLRPTLDHELGEYISQVNQIWFFSHELTLRQHGLALRQIDKVR